MTTKPTDTAVRVDQAHRLLWRAFPRGSASIALPRLAVSTGWSDPSAALALLADEGAIRDLRIEGGRATFRLAKLKPDAALHEARRRWKLGLDREPPRYASGLRGLIQRAGWWARSTWNAALDSQAGE
jgi:hypothetical protein